MHTKKYIISNDYTLQSKVYNYHTIETEVEFDGDRFHITQTDKDTGLSRNLTISEDDARDLRDIISEILEQGE